MRAIFPLLGLVLAVSCTANLKVTNNSWSSVTVTVNGSNAWSMAPGAFVWYPNLTASPFAPTPCLVRATGSFIEEQAVTFLLNPGDSPEFIVTNNATLLEISNASGARISACRYLWEKTASTPTVTVVMLFDYSNSSWATSSFAPYTFHLETNATALFRSSGPHTVTVYPNTSFVGYTYDLQLPARAKTRYAVDASGNISRP